MPQEATSALDPGWTRTIDSARNNPEEWNRYDTLLQSETNYYNTKFAVTLGVNKLDWKIFKALLWVESGGPEKWEGKKLVPNKTWTTRPMQIGNPFDAGYPALVHGEGASDIIMADDLKRRLSEAKVNPELNIRAGIAYLMTRLSYSDFKTFYDDPSSPVKDYAVLHNTSAESLARHLETNVAALQKLNSSLDLKKPIVKGTKVRYQKKVTKRVITGWRGATPQMLYSRYNIGDENYAAKIEYALGVIHSMESADATKH